MMTSDEQIQKLRRDEAALMTEWQTRRAQSACFNADGVVDYERWSALPDGKHIVVLLKETNGLHGSLVEFLYHGGSCCKYAAPESSGKELDIRVRKGFTSNRTIVKQKS